MHVELVKCIWEEKLEKIQKKTNKSFEIRGRFSGNALFCNSHLKRFLLRFMPLTFLGIPADLQLTLS